MGSKPKEGTPRIIPDGVTLTEDTPYTRLTLQQRHYVEARLQGLAPEAAKRAAGVAPRTPTTTLERNPTVRAAFKYLVQEAAQSVEELTKSDVLTGMMDAVNAAATAAELVMAWREVGKLLGAYEPEKKILEIRDYSADELKTLPDKELAKLAGGSMKGVIDDAEFEELPPRSRNDGGKDDLSEASG